MIGRTILTVARKETGILDIGGKRCKNSMDIPLELMQGNIIFKVKKKKNHKIVNTVKIYFRYEGKINCQKNKI